jgi:hypothetical protein
MSIDALSLWPSVQLTPQLALMICADRSARADRKSTLAAAISRSSRSKEPGSRMQPSLVSLQSRTQYAGGLQRNFAGIWGTECLKLR